MTSDATDAPPATDPAHGGAWFANVSSWIAWGGAALGAIRAVEILASRGVGVATVAEAAYQVVSHALAGLLLAVLVRALGIWAVRGPAAMHPQAIGPGSQAAPPPPAPAAEESTPRDDGATAEAAEVRRLIREGQWRAAEEAARAFAVDHAADPRGPILLEELARASRAAADRWLEQIRAARDVNDSARVLDLYEAGPPLDEAARRELDAELAGWFLSSVHRRLRSGLLQVEVVTLVERVSEAFGHTKEGASLRAALPTLRRGAGLCARCGKPYAGLADACPACLGAPEPPPPFIPELEPDPEPEEVEPAPARDEESSWFLDVDVEDDGPDGRDPGARDPSRN